MRNRLSQFVAFTLTLVIVLPLSLLAADWQWHRHLEREALNAQILQAEQSSAVKTEKLPPFKTNEEWRKYRLKGAFIPASSKFWRKQFVDGATGFVQLTEFRTITGNTYAVAIGWSETLEQSAQLPQGPISLLARLRPVECEAVDPSDMPVGQTNCPSTLATLTDQTVFLQSEQSYGLKQLPLPEIEAGPHLGYVGQWILIGLTALITYISLVRKLAIPTRA